jgi:AcrR family transcriptional regulator
MTETHLRRDAAENRTRILDAARALLAERGLEASMDEVARAAGVGPATLYRRFPTKETLLDALLGDVLERFHALVVEALESEDAFAGLTFLLERAILVQLENRAFLEVLALRLPVEPHLAETRGRIVPLVEQLVARAQSEGTLRADLEATDVQVLLWELGRVVESTLVCSNDLWRRYLGLMLDGLRADAARTLPQPAPTRAQLDRAMVETAERRGLSPSALQRRARARA